MRAIRGCDKTRQVTLLSCDPRRHHDLHARIIDELAAEKVLSAFELRFNPSISRSRVYYIYRKLLADDA